MSLLFALGYVHFVIALSGRFLYVEYFISPWSPTRKRYKEEGTEKVLKGRDNTGGGATPRYQDHPISISPVGATYFYVQRDMELCRTYGALIIGKLQYTGLSPCAILSQKVH